MKSRTINILLAIAVVVLLALLAFRVSFERRNDPGCCINGSGCSNRQR